MPKTGKKSSKKKKTGKKTTKPTNSQKTKQDLATDPIDISEILSKVKIFVTEFRSTGGRGALISNNLETKRDSDPFHILMSCIISLRTKDEVTEKIAEKLYSKVTTPADFLTLDVDQLSELIYPSAFYNNKAGQILELCSRLIDEFDSKVPDEIDTLLTFKGVGRKTANLVVTLGYNKPGICVDTHVARITQRIGFVPFKKYDEDGNEVFRSADEVEKVLRQKLPREWWIPINDLLVTYGQNVCVPISPKCSQCVIVESCIKVGVRKSR